MIEGIREILCFLDDTETVWKFQKMCGVEKVYERKSKSMGMKSLAKKTKTSTTDVKADKSAREHHHTCVNFKLKYNGFIDYFFRAVTFLGSDEFYIFFFPWCYWNIDPLTTHRVIVVWSISMIVGQTLKDVICIPRPKCPPVVHIEKRHLNEYSMPSTHSLVSSLIPLSIYFLISPYCHVTNDLIMMVLMLALMVPLSRIYVGVHRFSEVIAGSVIGIIGCMLLVPLALQMDVYISSWWSPVISNFIYVAVTYGCLPSDGKVTPNWSDTIVIAAAGGGSHTAIFMGIQSGIFDPPDLMLGICQLGGDRNDIGIITLFLRNVLGVMLLFSAFMIFHALVYSGLKIITDKSKAEIRANGGSHLFAKYTMYFCITVSLLFGIPYVLHCLGIGIKQ